MLKTELLPRPFSSDRPKVAGYEPMISGKVERVGRRKRNSWRATVFVEGAPKAIAHRDTKAAAESYLAGMIRAYASVHYIEV
jgi:hypothetical protein